MTEQPEENRKEDGPGPSAAAEENRQPGGAGEPVEDRNSGGPAEPAQSPEVDELKIAELLIQFERENENIRDYPRWKTGAFWAVAAWIFGAVIVALLYLPQFGQSEFSLSAMLIGASCLAVAVWAFATFRPSKD